MKKFKCILLIDDDSINNFLNRRLLAKMDLADNIEIANNGREAIDYIDEYCKSNNASEKKCCPELILLDINMPVMNGFEFLSTFQTLDVYDHTKVKIVVLTTSSNEKDTLKIRDFGITDYITKPLTVEKIQNVLQN